MRITAHELNGHAEFLNDYSFRLNYSPFQPGIPLGLYELPRRSGDAHLYRLNHPLAEAIIKQAKERALSVQEVCFDYSRHSGIISALKPLVGKSGWLTVSAFTVESLDQTEDHMIFGAVAEDGSALEPEFGRRIFSLAATENGPCRDMAPTTMHAIIQQQQKLIQQTISERNAGFYEAEAEKLEGWSDDLKLGLEREIKDFDRQIREARRVATAALTLEAKLNGQKQIKAIEALRNQKRRSLFEAQDKIDQQREDLISKIEGKLTQHSGLQELFTIRWSLQ